MELGTEELEMMLVRRGRDGTGLDTLRARTAKRKACLPEIAAHVKGAVS